MKIEDGDLLEPEIILTLLPVIERTVESFLNDFEGSIRDQVRDKVIDKFLSLKFPEETASKLKSRIIVITKNECRDFLRRYQRHGASIWFSGRADPGDREERRTLRIMLGSKGDHIKNARPQFRKIKAALGYKARTIKNLNLYQAWCNGMSRRRMADKFCLTEDQVRGRLEYTRKIIVITLELLKTSK